MDKLDTTEVCRRAAISEFQFKYLRKKFPDLLVPVAKLAGRYALWNPDVVDIILKCRTSLDHRAWDKRRAKMAGTRPVAE